MARFQRVFRAVWRWKTPGRLFFCAAITLIAGMGIAGGLSGCDAVFYQPDKIQRGSPAEASVAFEEVRFRTADGSMLHGWFMPAAGAARGTVLQVHGNAGNISGHYRMVSRLPAAGYQVFVFDYRGYGLSEGRASREGTIQDAAAALAYLQGRKDVDPNRIVVLGQSIGAAVSIVMAAEHGGEIRGLIADSGFSSYREIAAYHARSDPLAFVLLWWYPLFVRQGCDPIDHVGRIRDVPILFIHGKADRVAPWEMSQRMYERAVGEKEIWLIEGEGHLEAWGTMPEEVDRRVLSFLEKALGRATRRAADR